MRDGTSVLPEEKVFSPANGQASADQAVSRKCLFTTFGAARDTKENLRRIVERFGPDTFDYLLFIYDDSRYDDEFAYTICRFRRMAVIDAEVVKHLHKGTYHAEALAGQAQTHRRFRRFYFPKKRMLCPITDEPWDKHLTTPLRLHWHFLATQLHSLPGVVRLRLFLRARLHPTPLPSRRGQT